MKDNKEAKFHTGLVLEFTNYKKPDGEFSGQLWGNASELLSTPVAGKLRALGLVKGLPDLCYGYKKHTFGLELKCLGTRHNVLHLIEQAEFLTENYNDGWFIWDDGNMLWDTITHIEYEINNKTYQFCGNAKKVLNLLLSVKNSKKTQQISWDEVVRGIT